MSSILTELFYIDKSKSDFEWSSKLHRAFVTRHMEKWHTQKHLEQHEKGYEEKGKRSARKCTQVSSCSKIDYVLNSLHGISLENVNGVKNTIKCIFSPWCPSQNHRLISSTKMKRIFFLWMKIQYMYIFHLNVSLQIELKITCQNKNDTLCT